MFIGEPMKSQRATKAPLPPRTLAAAASPANGRSNDDSRMQHSHLTDHCVFNTAELTINGWTPRPLKCGRAVMTAAGELSLEAMADGLAVSRRPDSIRSPFYGHSGAIDL
ncbi:hypothetical protein MUK42_07795 [Musa troglodytarum]|uniref:Uncharacterized protein n=1 Tax=Musa troglodytarum TaxID=320322 RepID=A0A9E7I492_9LILI|nr:hypothetical protein MUK42_07795 [Musa troglodytarum]